MKVYSSIYPSGSFVANMEFRINDPKSGFSFAFGNGTGESDFSTGLFFRGYSGYIFDQSGNFFGGYRSGSRFEIEVRCFDQERAAYFFNNKLIANNLAVSGSINCIEFDKYGTSSVNMRLSSVMLDPDANTVPENAILYNNSAILYNGVEILF